MSRTLRRPMFRRGGPANDGIMSGIEDRKKFQDNPLKNFDIENVGKSAALSSNTIAVRTGGQTPSTNPTDVMDFVTIATTGNAADFGDLNVATKLPGTISDSHGGLQSA